MRRRRVGGNRETWEIEANNGKSTAASRAHRDLDPQSLPARVLMTSSSEFP